MSTFWMWVGWIARVLVILGVLALMGAMAKSLYDFVDERLYRRRQQRISLRRHKLEPQQRVKLRITEGT